MKTIRGSQKKWILDEKDVIYTIKVTFSKSNVANTNFFLSMISILLVVDKALAAM